MDQEIKFHQSTQNLVKELQAKLESIQINSNSKVSEIKDLETAYAKLSEDYRRLVESNDSLKDSFNINEIKLTALQRQAIESIEELSNCREKIASLELMVCLRYYDAK